MINLSKTPIKDNTTVNPNEPQPVAIQGDGKKCYEIKSIKDDCIYKLWHILIKKLLKCSQ